MASLLQQNSPLLIGGLIGPESIRDHQRSQQGKADRQGKQQTLQHHQHWNLLPAAGPIAAGEDQTKGKQQERSRFRERRSKA